MLAGKSGIQKLTDQVLNQARHQAKAYTGFGVVATV